jgi:hypothetical protein
MGQKEAKRYRKLSRQAIEMGTRAKFEVLVGKAKKALRRQAVLIGAIIALSPANVYAVYLLIKEIVK